MQSSIIVPHEDMPTVSVIIPSYNSAFYVGDTIRSVLRQTVQNLEVIVVDDGSTDNTEEVVRSIQDQRIQYRRKENSGVADSRNLGLQYARGVYVAFLDSDDIYEPENLSQKISFLECHPELALVYSAQYTVDKTNSRVLGVKRGQGGNVLNYLLELRSKIFTAPSAYLFRKSALQRIGGYDVHLSTSADWELVARFAAENDVGYIDTPLIRYRVHESQMSRSISLMQKDKIQGFEKFKRAGYFKSAGYESYCFARMYLSLAINYAAVDRNYNKAFSFFLRSISRNLKPLGEYVLSKYNPA